MGVFALTGGDFVFLFGDRVSLVLLELLDFEFAIYYIQMYLLWVIHNKYIFYLVESIS